MNRLLVLGLSSSILAVGCTEKRTDSAPAASSAPSSAPAASAATTAAAAALAAPSGSPGKFPQGSTRALTESDVSGLSCEDQSLMKNEIYARHGYKFKTKKLTDHFAKEAWYSGTSDNVEGTLTKIEVQNVALIDRIFSSGGCKAGAKAAKPIASGAPAPKCKGDEHWDDINKKCWPLGVCPDGYHWNEPMKTCLMNLE